LHAAEVRIGFVDIPYLIDQAPQSIAASARLEREFAPRQDAIKAQKREMEDLKRRLSEGEESLGDNEKSALQRELSKIERRVKRDEQEFREELNIQKNQEFKKVRVSVLEAIASFAKLHRYDLIISDGVLYADKRIDVSQQILEELQQAVTDTEQGKSN